MSTQPASSGENPALNDFSQLWLDALERYERETGKNLLEEPFAKDFPSSPGSAETIIARFEKQNESFKAFRTSGKKVLDVLRPIVDAVLLIKDCAEGVSDAVPGGNVIFGVIGVLLKATKGVRELYDAIETLFDEIKGYLERVSIHLPKPSTTRTPLAPSLMNILADTLVQIFTALALATKYCNIAFEREHWFKKVARVFFRRTKDFFIVLADQTDVSGVLKKIKDLTNAELLASAAQTNTIVREIHPWVKFVHDKAVLKDLRTWLRAPERQPRNVESKRQTDSCKWFFNDEFEAWKTQRNGVYWVYGHAGAGKSVLCSSVIDALRTDQTLFLAYFYFDYSDTAKQDCRALASSLVFQLGTCSEECQNHLLEKQSSDSPTYAELLELLSGLLSLSGRTFIVIDALDECPERARDYTGLWRFFEHLRNLQSQDNVDLRVLVTSRPEIDIQDCMAPVATHTLNINVAAEHAEDMKIYLSTRLFGLESKSFWKWDADVKWRVFNSLIERSGGMFLWVVLQLHDLRDCVSNDVDRALDELPSDLDGTYERVLKNFSSKPTMVTRARRLFECVAFATYPLSPAQLAEIASIDFNSVLPYHVASPSDGTATNILQTCPRLLEIVSDDKEHTTVQFIHRSVKEYLTSTKLREAISSLAYLYSFDEYSAHLTLAKICLSVLVTDGPGSDLQAYADGHWYDHVSSRNEDALGELLDSFLQTDSPSFARWEGRTQYDINTAFHWVAYFGLYRRVERMLERARHYASTPDGFVRTRDGFGRTALNWAAYWGHVDVCRLLLEHGALVEDTENDGYTPLHYAASNGHLDVVRLLLEFPTADGSNAAALRCRIRNKRGQTALHRAAYFGRAEICRLLLEHGALVDEADNDGKTPLQLAKEERELDVVDILSKHGATAVSGTLSLEGESDSASSS